MLALVSGGGRVEVANKKFAGGMRHASQCGGTEDKDDYSIGTPHSLYYRGTFFSVLLLCCWIMAHFCAAQWPQGH